MNRSIDEPIRAHFGFFITQVLVSSVPFWAAFAILLFALDSGFRGSTSTFAHVANITTANVTANATAPLNASCAANSGCFGLSGLCCPTAQGVSLTCCEYTRECSANPFCGGLEGDCCPTANGNFLDCCSRTAVPAARALSAESGGGEAFLLIDDDERFDDEFNGYGHDAAAELAFVAQGASLIYIIFLFTPALLLLFEESLEVSFF
jgi:hypothetical protein